VPGTGYVTLRHGDGSGVCSGVQTPFLFPKLAAFYLENSRIQNPYFGTPLIEVKPFSHS
jgi:hypothetical protein